MQFTTVEGVEPNDNWDEKDGWKEAPCPAGTIVLIHGASRPKLARLGLFLTAGR